MIYVYNPQIRRLVEDRVDEKLKAVALFRVIFTDRGRIDHASKREREGELKRDYPMITNEPPMREKGLNRGPFGARKPS